MTYPIAATQHLRVAERHAFGAEYADNIGAQGGLVVFGFPDIISAGLDDLFG